MARGSLCVSPVVRRVAERADTMSAVGDRADSVSGPESNRRCERRFVRWSAPGPFEVVVQHLGCRLPGQPDTVLDS
jgi:hypothetical protein